MPLQRSNHMLEPRMKKRASLVALVLVGASAFAVGMFYGFSEGARNYALLEQVAVGAVSRHQLAALDKGKPEYVTHLLELNVDSAIDRYALYQLSGNKLLSEYYFQSHTENLERYVDALAEYRKTHPIVFSADWANPESSDDAEAPEFKKQGHAESLAMIERIRSVLRDRAVPESALKNQPSPTR